jgi:hypothetical protein
VELVKTQFGRVGRGRAFVTCSRASDSALCLAPSICTTLGLSSRNPNAPLAPEGKSPIRLLKKGQELAFPTLCFVLRRLSYASSGPSNGKRFVFLCAIRGTKSGTPSATHNGHWHWHQWSLDRSTANLAQRTTALGRRRWFPR